jgi:hypothetical protein
LVTTRQPSGANDLGETTAAFYFVDDGVLAMCDQDGRDVLPAGAGR